MAASDLRIVQLGHETQFGTDVTPTVKLRGITDASLSPRQEAKNVEEIGSLGPSSLANVLRQSGEGSFEGVQTYEDAPLVLSMLFGVGAPSAGPPYTRDYVAPLAAAPTPELQSIEFGAPGAGYLATSCLLTKYRETIEEGNFATFGVDFVCPTIEPLGSFTSLSDRAVEAVRAADTKLYLDAWGGTMGSTLVAATVIKADIEIDPKYHLKNFLGSLTPESWGYAKWAFTLKMTVEFATTAKAIADALVAGGLIQRLIELRSTSSTNVIKRQFAAKLVDGFELFTDREGNMTLDLTFDGQYQGTFANHIKYSVTNAVAVLP